ncbi:hypothetical protein IMPR6_170064 [Imperialibacter sp. EC-SDR9]|nr:hypothetical protein IMPERIA75_290046 [Imperialibacter sp. 75]CAD5275720.1 hypothetical protein IMPERIA89_400063 [Imperialibacter sp. 89]VVT08403.1 hypothetical protein IMPR6_170064 [Imperialibacter sp. EC-SDR9]
MIVVSVKREGLGTILLSLKSHFVSNILPLTKNLPFMVKGIPFPFKIVLR